MTKMIRDCNDCSGHIEIDEDGNINAKILINRVWCKICKSILDGEDRRIDAFEKESEIVISKTGKVIIDGAPYKRDHKIAKDLDKVLKEHRKNQGKGNDKDKDKDKEDE